MKFSKITALLTIATLVPLNAGATANVLPVPVYEYFSSTDINGSVTIELPENVKADVDITIDTPELSSQPYYSEKSLDSSSSYTFRLEGRDKTPDDYQTYTLSVMISSSEKYMEKPYTFTFDVPDGNDHPDSFADYKFVFTADDTESAESWETVSENGTELSILVHLKSNSKGDVNGDGSVNSIDASLIMAHYTSLSAENGKPVLNEGQKSAGDINGDGSVNAVDASLAMAYYSYVSTNPNISIDDFLSKYLA